MRQRLNLTPVAELLLIASALFAGACTSAGVSSEGDFQKDAAAQSAVKTAAASLQSTRSITPEAFKALRDAFEKYPNASPIRDVYRQALISREDWDAIEKFLTDGGRELSQDDRVLLGQVYVKSGKYQQAADTLQPIVTQDPNDLEANRLLAYAYFHLDRIGEASAALDRVWQQIVDAKRHDEMTLRGLIYLREDNFPKAIEVLNAAHEIAPDHIAANNALSRAYARMDNTEKAEYHRRLTVEGQDRAVRDRLRGSDNVRKVVELEQAWKAKEHSRVIQLAREILPSSPPAQQFVAYQYIYESSKALGDEAGAQRALAEAQRLKGSLR